MTAVIKDEILLALTLNHDTGAALFINGDLRAAVNEERLNREKLTRKFPEKSILEVLGLSGLRPEDVTKVVVGSRISPNWISLLIPGFHEEQSADIFSPLYRAVIWEQKILRKTGLIKQEGELARGLVSRRLNILDIHAPVILMDHHICHCYSAYSTAHFDDMLVVSLDLMGDGLSTLVCAGRNGILTPLFEGDGFDSPAFVYSKITQLLGFRQGRHEGKITGLAAYGDPHQCGHLFRRMMRFENGALRTRFIGSPDHRLFREIMKYEPRHIAAGLQKVLEEVVTEYV